MKKLFSWGCCDTKTEKEEMYLSSHEKNHDSTYAELMGEGSDVMHPSFSSTANIPGVGSTKRKERTPATIEMINALEARISTFRTKVLNGMNVQVVSTETGEKENYFFQMDRFLTTFSLKAQNDYYQKTLVHDIPLRDVRSIFSAQLDDRRVPIIFSTKMILKLVGIETNRFDQRIFFYFDDSLEQIEFFQCMKIFKISVDTPVPPSPALSDSRDIAEKGLRGVFTPGCTFDGNIPIRISPRLSQSYVPFLDTMLASTPEGLPLSASDRSTASGGSGMIDGVGRIPARPVGDFHHGGGSYQFYRKPRPESIPETHSQFDTAIPLVQNHNNF